MQKKAIISLSIKQNNFCFSRALKKFILANFTVPLNYSVRDGLGPFHVCECAYVYWRKLGIPILFSSTLSEWIPDTFWWSRPRLGAVISLILPWLAVPSWPSVMEWWEDTESWSLETGHPWQVSNSQAFTVFFWLLTSSGFTIAISVF